MLSPSGTIRPTARMKAVRQKATNTGRSTDEVKTECCLARPGRNVGAGEDQLAAPMVIEDCPSSRKHWTPETDGRKTAISRPSAGLPPFSGRLPRGNDRSFFSLPPACSGGTTLEELSRRECSRGADPRDWPSSTGRSL